MKTFPIFLFFMVQLATAMAGNCNTGDKYAITLLKVFGSEGLCQNSASDSGNMFQGKRGYTCMGLTPGTAYNNRAKFTSCSGYTGHPADFSKWCYDKSPANFKTGAAQVYKDSYFKPCNNLAMPAFYVCADISINSGQGTAQKYLTKLGPPGSDLKDYAKKLNELHRQLYRKIGGPNLQGWLNRAAARDRYINSC